MSDVGPNLGLVWPVVRIETLGALRQSVAVFGCAAPPGNPLEQSRRMGAEPGCRSAPRARPSTDWSSSTTGDGAGGAAGPVTRPAPLLALRPSRSRSRRLVRRTVDRFAAKDGPVETHVRVGVLQGLADLLVEGVRPKLRWDGDRKR